MHLTLPLALALVAGACASKQEAARPGAELIATWDGRDRGSGRLEATALHCPRDSTLQILAHQGDRGIGLAVHLATAGPVTGSFALVHPETHDIPRPAATGAYRFLTIEALHPFVSRNGTLDLTEIGPGWVSGTIVMTLVAQSGTDTVAIRGSFSRVPVDSTRTPCGLAPPAPVEVF